jgi:hypothetical protein
MDRETRPAVLRDILDIQVVWRRQADAPGRFLNERKC